MTIMTTSREADAYLEAVREELADLPEEERGELLEDLAQHLSDIASDESRAELPLTELLGAPAEYASELRTAAGLPSKDSRRRMKVTPPDLRGWLNQSSLGKWMNGPTGQRYIAPAVSFVRELVPAWWVARAVIAVVGFFVLVSPAGWQEIPVPSVLGSRLVGLVLIGLAVVLSVRLGRRGYRGRKRLVLAADAVVALLGLSLVMDASLRLGAFQGGNVVYQASVSTNYALASPHGPITNIYPYDSQGRPLEDVLLYDQDGRPLRAERQQWWADGCERMPAHPLAADGVPVEFSYPITYAVDLHVFGSAPDADVQRYRDMYEERCDANVQRPSVPIPTFPAPPAAASPTTDTTAQPAP